MILLYWTLLIYALFRAIRGVLRVVSSLKWVNLNSKKIKLTNLGKGNVKLYFLIPVLREQEIIDKTFKNFTNLSGDYKLVFITTNKEKFDKDSNFRLLNKLKKKILKSKNKDEFVSLLNGIFPASVALELYGKIWKEIITSYKKLPFTGNMLNNLIINSPTRVKNKASVINYPKITGNMSDQLNYAIKNIIRKEKYLDETFICIYNADSIVSNNLPNLIRNFINKNPNAEVIQQSALFLSNYNQFTNNMTGSFLKSIALLQSRWTLAHELPRIFNQINTKSECAHIVGHGLIIKIIAMKKAGYFPTNYINEDLPFGYILKLNGYDIYPFPQLESAQSPTSIRSMFTQYTTWFYGAFHYPRYMLNAFKEFPDKKLQAFIWGFKYTIRSVLWLGLSFVWLFLFLYPVSSQKYYLLILSSLVFFVYAPFCFYITENFLNNNKSIIFGENVFENINIDLKTYLMTLPAYLTHSYGPIKATVETINYVIFGTQIIKKKTER